MYWILIKSVINIMNFLGSVENDQIVHYLICSPFFVLIIFVFGIASRASYECLDEAEAFEKAHKVFNVWCLLLLDICSWQ